MGEQDHNKENLKAYKLNESVKSYETGGTTDIYIGGSSEIRHLGYSVKKSYEQIEILMQEIIRQQNERRKSEMDALQSQINPHFLYNTLESITWMVKYRCSIYDI